MKLLKFLQNHFVQFLLTFVLGAVLLGVGAWATETPMFDKDQGVTDEQFNRIYTAAIAAMVIGSLLILLFAYKAINHFSSKAPTE